MTHMEHYLGVYSRIVKLQMLLQVGCLLPLQTQVEEFGVVCLSHAMPSLKVEEFI
jgi:hypothetical protein